MNIYELNGIDKEQMEYSALVTKLIRERYSLDAELAIHRQRDTKPQEFAEYNEYCEECKRRAREQL